jgi:hypothetical protein
MVYAAAVKMQVYPLAAIVKVGDTESDTYGGVSDVRSAICAAAVACSRFESRDKRVEDKKVTTVADEVTAIFADKGRSAYFGEDVSQLKHALQAAYLAWQNLRVMR